MGGRAIVLRSADLEEAAKGSHCAFGFGGKCSANSQICVEQGVDELIRLLVSGAAAVGDPLPHRSSGR
jgi:acyl-CoA reductase-like NAD-dependent aldehyde dehydrogenase